MAAGQWFYAKAGQQQGPVTFEQLQELARSGQLAGADLVWTEGMGNWAPASSVKDLIPASAPAEALPPIAAQAPQTAAPISYQGPAMGMQMGYAPPAPKNYLAQAIIVTLCCCIPFGIPAIVYAAQVNSKHQSGDYAGAQEASRKANFWSWMAFWFGLAANLIGVGLQVAVEMNK